MKYILAAAIKWSCFLLVALLQTGMLVQETKDGELVVLHDLSSLLEASKEAEINTEAMHKLQATNSNLSKLSLKV